MPIFRSSDVCKFDNITYSMRSVKFIRRRDYGFYFTFCELNLRLMDKIILLFIALTLLLNYGAY